MAYPAAWPPRAPSGRRSLRVYAAGTTSANWSDNAIMFAQASGGSADPYSPLPVVKTGQLTDGGLGIGNTSAPTVVPTAPWGTGITDPNSPPAQTWAMGIRISNDGASNIECTFDGTNVHCVIKAGTEVSYLYRHESGIALRGAGGASVAFRVEAW